MMDLRVLLAVAATASSAAAPAAAQGTHLGVHTGLLLLEGGVVGVGVQAHIPIGGRVELKWR